jgi:hypothetical protein
MHDENDFSIVRSENKRERERERAREQASESVKRERSKIGAGEETFFYSRMNE